MFGPMPIPHLQTMLSLQVAVAMTHEGTVVFDRQNSTRVLKLRDLEGGDIPLTTFLPV